MSKVPMAVRRGEMEMFGVSLDLALSVVLCWLSSIADYAKYHALARNIA